MTNNKLKVVYPHRLPKDLLLMLNENLKVKSIWQSLTPLAQNEFICWSISTKNTDTRIKRIKRIGEELLGGKRRPCCWIGCTHRQDKALSQSQKWMLKK